MSIPRNTWRGVGRPVSAWKDAQCCYPSKKCKHSWLSVHMDLGSYKENVTISRVGKDGKVAAAETKWNLPVLSLMTEDDIVILENNWFGNSSKCKHKVIVYLGISAGTQLQENLYTNVHDRLGQPECPSADEYIPAHRQSFHLTEYYSTTKMDKVSVRS